MSKKRVLITDRFAADSLQWLQRQPHLTVTQSDHPRHLPLESLVSANALLIRSRTPIDEALLKKARQLQVIITATSGFDHIDLEATQKWGVTVMHTPTANIESAAQLTWALVLACAHRLPEARPQVDKLEWDRGKLTGLELAGRNYGVIGLGRIGSRVARIAQAFGMNVLACDPYVDEAIFEKSNATRLKLEELLRSADVFSFHVPKTLETDKMMGPAQFENLPGGQILINTSRGSVIDESALVKALGEKTLRAAGLDVFTVEPLSEDSPLLQMPQVVLSPHIGANTDEAFFKASQIAAEKLVEFFLDGSTSETLPPRVPWHGATPFKGD